MSKPDRIRNAIDRTVGRFTKAQLLETCPDISETTMNGANAQTTAGRSLHPQDRRRLRLGILQSVGDKASYLHDFPDYAVEDKIVPNCYAIVWMFAKA